MRQHELLCRFQHLGFPDADDAVRVSALKFLRVHQQVQHSRGNEICILGGDVSKS